MNPYTILRIDKGADKREVIQAAAKALRERKYSSREVALAQKQLLDPVSRGVQEFLRFTGITLHPPWVEPFRVADRPATTSIKRLTVFEDNRDGG